MKKEVITVLLVVAILAGAGVGYLIRGANERVVTSVSTSVTTLTGVTTSSSTLTIYETTTTTLEQTASVIIENYSVPASAWSHPPGGNMLQCGYAQPFGSGSITLNNTGNGPVAVGDLIIYLGYTNQTEYLASAVPNVQSCTISPSGSLTFYFSLYGPTPPNCQYFTAYLLLSNGYDVSFSGNIGANCTVIP